jgi:glycosyltransferase involved in cell wall biosynthesis
MSSFPNKNSIWVVIPAYNEAGVIADVVNNVLQVFPHVVIIDDGGTDKTADCAYKAGAHTLRHVVNLGQGAALKTGIDYALQQGASHIVTFDADGQHRLEDAQQMLALIQQHDVDVVLGSRFLGSTENMPPSRRALLKGAVVFTRLLSGLAVTDTHNGLRVLNRVAAEKIQIRQNRMAHASEILHEIARHGLRYVECPVTIVYTDYSLAKGQSMRNSLRILEELFLGRMAR